MIFPAIAISICQPWAWCIVWAGKRVENRTWVPHVKPPFDILIHASAQTSKAEHDAATLAGLTNGCRVPKWETASKRLATTVLTEKSRTNPKDLLVYGGILGVARVAKIEESPLHFIDHQARRLLAWECKGGYAWHLTDVRPVTFVRCRGLQKIWKVPVSVRHQLRLIG